MIKIFLKLALLAVCVSLSACVTTTTDRIQVDEKAALETHIRSGMIYLQRDNRDAARRHFVSALELNDDSAEAWQGMAILHQLNGEMERAEESFQKALDGTSVISDSSTHLAYGRFLLAQERYEEAFGHFQIAADDFKYPSRATAMYYLGYTALKLERPGKAKATLEHALQLDGHQLGAMIELAEIYFAEQKYAKAKDLLDRFAQLTEHTPRSLWLGIRIERIFGNKNKEASYALMLKNMHPYSKEYLEYKRLIGQ